ncbi:HNH endonuclease [Aliarcobacter cryaerophilus]|uniref:HNH endonuclease n=1 Tax=Aliarcobacter cryaerophilus TaxID=28198 RepID=UPI0021B66531|nr:HNH endonuclease [Aliarcobacter cryaerophilus]MCT7500127.1 HNH endonuclease [Aliarcobacter cryaerophilus]
MVYKIACSRHKSIIDRNAMAGVTLKLYEFEKWYGDDSKDRQCEYCLIKESEIKDLISKGKIYTKRLTTRGRTMEVDRKDPKGHYEINNLIMSCYWCNNAKTDEFSYEEFRKMSCRTNDIWEKRLNSQSLEPSINKVDKLRCDWDEPIGVVLPLLFNKVQSVIKEILNQISQNKLNTDFKIYLVYKETSTNLTKVNNAIKEICKKLGLIDLKLLLQTHKEIVFLPIPHLDTIWINGCMPLKVISKENGDNKALKAVYSPSFYTNDCYELCGKGYRKYAYYEHISALEIAEALDLQIRYISKQGGGYWYENCKDDEVKNDTEKPIILDNNDFVHNGTVGFISQRVLEENCITCNEKKDEFLERFMKYTNLKKICVLQTKVDKDCSKQQKGKSKEYGFLSDKIRFLNEKTLLIKEFFYKEIDLEECCKVVKDFCEEENINIEKISFDLDYLRVGNLILHNNKISETPNELMFKDFIFKKIESDESLFSISWVF